MLCDDGCSGKCDGDCIEPSPTNPRAQDVLHRVGHGDALLRYAQVACAAFVEFQSLSSELTLFHNGSACKCSRNSTQSALGTMHFLSSQMRATHPGSPPRITAFAGPAYPGPLHSTAPMWRSRDLRRASHCQFDGRPSASAAAGEPTCLNPRLNRLAGVPLTNKTTIIAFAQNPAIGVAVSAFCRIARHL
jgi:hypothetical protein